MLIIFRRIVTPNPAQPWPSLSGKGFPIRFYSATEFSPTVFVGCTEALDSALQTRAVSVSQARNCPPDFLSGRPEISTRSLALAAVVVSNRYGGVAVVTKSVCVGPTRFRQRTTAATAVCGTIVSEQSSSAAS